jgi:hypothetical protein
VEIAWAPPTVAEVVVHVESAALGEIVCAPSPDTREAVVSTYAHVAAAA